jgi:hypothetical protein
MVVRWSGLECGGASPPLLFPGFGWRHINPDGKTGKTKAAQKQRRTPDQTDNQASTPVELFVDYLCLNPVTDAGYETLNCPGIRKDQ